MNNETIEFLGKFDGAIKNCARFCYATRTKEYQVEAINDLIALSQELAAQKAESVAASDGDSANFLLSLEFRVFAIRHELRMWVALKEDKPAIAWDELIEAQISIMNAIRAHKGATDLTLYLEKLELLEKLLFPPIIFVSIAMIIRASKCSICGSEYGECNHIKGMPYMGQFCVREITEFETLERSIVPFPANKHARMAAVSDGNTTRDLLTWRIVSDDPMEYTKGIYGEH